MKREDLRGDAIFVIHEFLPAEKYRELIEFSEKQGYEDAPITSAGGFEMRKDLGEQLFAAFGKRSPRTTRDREHRAARSDVGDQVVA